MHVVRSVLLFAVLVTSAFALAQAPLAPAQPSSRIEDTKTTGTPEKKPRITPPLTWGDENEYKLQFGGEMRLRAERRRNYDMNRKTRDNDSLQFFRTKLNFDLSYRQYLRTFMEVMDAREWNANTDQNQSVRWDVHQFFIEYYNKKVSPWGVRAGRQELNFGERRLVEASSWSNLIRTFDGVDVFRKNEDNELHMFVMQQDIYDVRRDGVLETDRRQPKNREWFYGIYNTFKCYDPHEIDLYFLGLSDLHDNRTFPSAVKSEDGVPGTTDRYTVGSRARGPLWKIEDCGTLGYGVEAAYQFGHRSRDDIDAYMLHSDINYQWEHKWKPTVILEGNLASGDKRALDGETNTFNPLFGSSHTPYGIIDFTRLQNLREIALSGQIQPTKKLKARVELHNFWLDSKRDSWYDSKGSSLGKDSAGKSGRNIGHELDVIVTYTYNKFMKFEVGAAHFTGGTFARNVGRKDNANLLYLQTVITF